MKVKSEREVAQSYMTLSDPMDCSLPGPSVHGIFQARVPEWGAIAFSALFCYIILNGCAWFPGTIMELGIDSVPIVSISVSSLYTLDHLYV